MRPFKVFTVFVAFVSLAGLCHAQSVPDEKTFTDRVITLAVPSGLPVAKATEAVVRAGIGRRWNIVHRTPGYVELHLVHRRYDARLHAYIDANSVRIYSVSKRTDRPGRADHPKGWISNLERDIPVFMQQELHLQD